MSEGSVEQEIGWRFVQYLPAIATLTAAFLGNWFAFKLRDRSEKRSEANVRVACINRALMALFQQVNTLATLRQQVIDPSRQDSARAINMRAVVPIPPATMSINLESLVFVLETKQGQLLSALMIAQEQFNAAIQAMNERSQIHLTQIQPKLAQAGIREGKPVMVKDIESIVGASLLRGLTRMTDDMIEIFDDTIDSSTDLSQRLQAAGRELFPGRSFAVIDRDSLPRVGSQPQ